MSLLFSLILPLLLALPAAYRLRPMRAARRLGLLTPAGYGWLLGGLAAALALVWLAQAALVFQTRLELPLAALAALAVLMAAARQARPHLHPGLRGLRRPVPRDGLDIIERETHRPPAWRRAVNRLKPLATLLPAWLLMAWLAAAHPDRGLGFGLLALLAAAPLLLTPHRRLWLLPLSLTLPLAVLYSQAYILRPTLPPGVWAAPISGARCPGLLRAAPDGPRAWCVDLAGNRLYAINMGSGALAVNRLVPEGARVFAANAATAWVQQIPASGLVRVDAAGGIPEPLRVASAHQGAADSAGRLWVMDVSREMTLFAPGEEPRKLTAADGLLNNTAYTVRAAPNGDVWVGSVQGASRLPAGETAWQTLAGIQDGVPGAVVDFAFAPDGAVWMLWVSRPGYSPQTNWGLSRRADGEWLHAALGPHFQLDVPRSEAPLAVDGQGRVWLVTQELPLRRKVLGVFTPPGSGAAPPPGSPAVPSLDIYPLGSFPAGGPYGYGGSLWRDGYGVAADGAGGILLFNGPGAPVRRWLR